ncbi:MAG TPA: methyltransferase domain-containing protein [Puia sp.]|nr:methyltransferase domain-containing protein [Puia sp.]
MPTPPAFTGTIPENYDRYLGPYIFEPFALDIAGRVPSYSRRILEVACGTGRVTAHLCDNLRTAELIATDINPDMLAIAKKRVDRRNIHWQQADVQALPFETGQFDAVVCQFGLMFVPDQSAALRELYRVLRPGGRLLLSTWDKLENNPSFFLANRHVAGYFPDEPPTFFQVPFSLYDPEWLKALTGNAGFADVTINPVSKPCKSDSAADVATGMLEGSPMYTTIMARDAALLPEINASLTAALAAEFGDKPLQSPMKAWMVSGSVLPSSF